MLYFSNYNKKIKIFITFVPSNAKNRNMKPIIQVTNGVPRHPSYRMKEPVNFVMEQGEHIALVGPNGGGKSLLVDILIGRWPLLMKMMFSYWTKRDDYF